MKRRALWQNLESIAQDALAFVVALPCTVEVRKINVGGNKCRIESNRCFDFFFRLRRLAAICIEGSEIDARFDPIRIIFLAGYILGARSFKSAALRRVQLIRPARARAGSPPRCAALSADR